MYAYQISDAIENILSPTLIALIKWGFTYALSLLHSFIHSAHESAQALHSA